MDNCYLPHGIISCYQANTYIHTYINTCCYVSIYIYIYIHVYVNIYIYIYMEVRPWNPPNVPVHRPLPCKRRAAATAVTVDRDAQPLPPCCARTQWRHGPGHHRASPSATPCQSRRTPRPGRRRKHRRGPTPFRLPRPHPESDSRKSPRETQSACNKPTRVPSSHEAN